MKDYRVEFKVNRAELVLEMLRDESVTARDVMQVSIESLCILHPKSTWLNV